MKKIKLITTLSTLGITAVSIPVVATSCSNNEVKVEYKLNSISWTPVVKVGETSNVSDFDLTRNGEKVSPTLIIDCVNDGSSTELGVNSTNILEIQPTQEGEWDYKIKLTIYTNEKKESTDIVSFSTKVKVNSADPQVLKTILKDGNVSNDYVVATAATESTAVLGQLGVILYDENNKEMSQKGQTITYTIKEVNKPNWLTSCSVNDKGQITTVINPEAIDPTNLRPFKTKWYAQVGSVTSIEYSLYIWCTPYLTQNELIVCDKVYEKYEQIALPETITNRDISRLSTVTDSKITILDSEGEEKTLNIEDIIYISITKAADEFYMVFDDFCRNWTNLCYVNFSGLTNIEIIGKYAFAGCKNLLEVSFEGASKLHLFYDYAFSGCGRLQSIDFSDVCQGSDYRLIFEQGVLSDCASLRKINLSNFANGTIIMEGFAYSCPNLEEIVVNNTNPDEWEVWEDVAYDFANYDKQCSAFTDGIKVTGDDPVIVTEFKQKFPQNTVGPWELRKWQ